MQVAAPWKETLGGLERKDRFKGMLAVKKAFFVQLDNNKNSPLCL
jgi:hypothetical protein